MDNRHGHPLTPEQKEARRIEYWEMALDFYEKNRRSPRMADLPFPYRILKVYATWNDFLEDCGLDVNYSTVDVEKDALISNYKLLVHKLERSPYALEFYQEFGCQSAVRKFFGSWNKLVKTCKLRFNRVTGTEKDELVERVIELSRELGKTPTTREFNDRARENNLCSTMVIQRYFGTWTKCLKCCKLEPNINRKSRKRKDD